MLRAGLRGWPEGRSPMIRFDAARVAVGVNRATASWRAPLSASRERPCRSAFFAPEPGLARRTRVRARNADPRATQAPVRRTPTCKAVPAKPIAEEENRPSPCSRRLRPCGVEPDHRRAPLRPPAQPRPKHQAIPSIKPSAAAGAPRVTVRNEGRSAVGTSWPRSASRTGAADPGDAAVQPGRLLVRLLITARQSADSTGASEP